MEFDMRPIASEKAVRLIEAENTLVFEVPRKVNKSQIKKNIEELFEVKIQSVNTSIRKNKKYAYVKLKAENPAIDLATKLGII